MDAMPVAGTNIDKPKGADGNIAAIKAAVPVVPSVAPQTREAFYDDLSKAFHDAVTVIRWLIYPVAGIVTIALVYFGMTIGTASRDIENLRKQAKKDFADLHQNYVDAKVEVEQLRKENVRLREESAALQSAAKKTLNSGQEAIARLAGNEKSFKAFSDSSEKLVSNYKAQIDLAKLGADEKLTMANSLVKQEEQRLEAIKKASLGLAKYAELTLKGRGTFPDPNLNEEVQWLNSSLSSLGITVDEYKNAKPGN